MKWIRKVSTTPLDDKAKVIDTLDTQTNERRNAPSIHAVREMFEDFVLSTIYPVGSIYISTVDVNPSTYFGGVWQKIEDKFLLGNGTKTVGASGGAETFNYTPNGTVGLYALTATDIPPHTHTVDVTEPGTVSYEWVNGDYQTATSQVDAVVSVVKNATTKTTSSVGSGGAHNHAFTGSATTINKMPPYLVVTMWKRIG